METQQEILDQSCEKKEIKGREMYKAIFSGNNYNHLFSEYKYESWDVITENIIKDTKIIAEIKSRKYNINFFHKYPPYLEQTKLNGILKTIEEQKINTSNIYYINLATDGVQVYIIEEDFEYKWEKKWLQENDYSKKKVLKDVAELPIEHLVYERKI